MGRQRGAGGSLHVLCVCVGGWGRGEVGKRPEDGEEKVQMPKSRLRSAEKNAIPIAMSGWLGVFGVWPGVTSSWAWARGPRWLDRGAESSPLSPWVLQRD